MFINDPPLKIIGTIVSSQLNDPWTVVMSGTTAFVTAGGANRITAVSLADPAHPTITSSLQDATNLAGVTGAALFGNYLVVCAFNADRLTLVDISNPASMSVAGSVTNATSLDGVIDVVMNGNIAICVAQNSSRLTTVNCTTPGSPTISGSITNSNLVNPIGVAMKNATTAVIVNNNSVGRKLVTANVSTPATPTVTGNVAVDTQPGAWNVRVSGNYAFSTDANTNGLALHVTDITTVATPSYVGSASGSINDTQGINLFTYRGNSYAFVAGATDNTVALVNLTTPTSPVVTATLTDLSLDNAQGLTVYNNAYGIVACTLGTSSALTVVRIN